MVRVAVLSSYPASVSPIWRFEADQIGPDTHRWPNSRSSCAGTRWVVSPCRTSKFLDLFTSRIVFTDQSPHTPVTLVGMYWFAWVSCCVVFGCRLTAGSRADGEFPRRCRGRQRGGRPYLRPCGQETAHRLGRRRRAALVCREGGGRAEVSHALSCHAVSDSRRCWLWCLCRPALLALLPASVVLGVTVYNG